MNKGFAMVGIAMALVSNAALSRAAEFAQSKAIAVSSAATTIAPQLNCSGYPIIISQPGSYVLSGSITLTCGADAIDVKADNVVIDLGGQTITGPGSGNGFGIKGSTHTNVTVKNGSVVKMGAAGISLGANATVEDVTASSNGFDGIDFLSGGIIHDVHANGNFGEGISIQGDTSEVSDCEVKNNNTHGIFMSNPGSILRNVIVNNRGNGIFAEGSSNTIFSNNINGNGLSGILGFGTISNNSIANNGGSGIDGGGQISNNTIVSNGTLLMGFGIHVFESPTSIVGNTIGQNYSYGITSDETPIASSFSYGNNQLIENKGNPFPSPGTQVHLGVQMGPNICDGVACP